MNVVQEFVLMVHVFLDKNVNIPISVILIQNLQNLIVVKQKINAGMKILEDVGHFNIVKDAQKQ